MGQVRPPIFGPVFDPSSGEIGFQFWLVFGLSFCAARVRPVSGVRPSAFFGSFRAPVRYFSICYLQIIPIVKINDSGSRKCLECFGVQRSARIMHQRVHIPVRMELPFRTLRSNGPSGPAPTAAIAWRRSCHTTARGAVDPKTPICVPASGRGLIIFVA